ncbi:MAG: TetR family transcriptional regulator C-terminal domain-containing protein [Dehalococcoidia bacterium]
MGAGAERGQALRTASEAASGRPLELLRGVAGFLGPGSDGGLWPALLLGFWSHASRNPRVREGVASVASFRREALLRALHAAAEAGVIRPTLAFDECADLLLTLGDGLLARVGRRSGRGVARLPARPARRRVGVHLGPRSVGKNGETPRRTGTD